jgi:cephalosporin hydroxylase
VTETIAQRYHHACRTPSDIYEHLPFFVALATRMNAQTIIELGTRGGVSTLAWIYAMQETDGHVWSVDIDPPPEFTDERWTFVQGSDLDPKVLAQLPRDVDVCFIDTSHEYAQTLSELHVYAPRVRAGGRIVLHDTELRAPFGLHNQPPFPVKKAITEFCTEEGLAWTNHPNCFGLGVIQIPE